MQAQRVAHVVETEAVSQLGIEQADDMAPRAEAACVIFDAGARASFGTRCAGMKLQSCRKSENLPAVGLAVVFFSCPTLWQAQTRKPTFSCLSTLTLWSANVKKFTGGALLTSRLARTLAHQS